MNAVSRIIGDVVFVASHVLSPPAVFEAQIIEGVRVLILRHTKYTRADVSIKRDSSGIQVFVDLFDSDDFAPVKSVEHLIPIERHDD